MYNDHMTNRTRLTTDQKMRALALIARGDTLSQVAAHLLEHFDVKVSESALSQLKKAHKETIDKMQVDIAEGQSAEADAIAKRARRMLNNKLDRAERDARTLEEVDEDWRNGKIKDAETYRRRKAGLIKVSIAELNQISKTMHHQAKPDTPPPAGDGAPQLPAGGVGHGSTPAQLEALLKAIAAGNTVEIQRLIFTPKVRNDIPVTV